MKIIVKQDNLARGLGTVGRAVASRATLPVLANVLLRTEDGGLKLTATNLEIGITCWVGCKVDEPGEITVPARLLTDLVGSLPAGENIDLELSPKDLSLKVSCGGSRASIKGIAADEFPVVGAIGEAPLAGVGAGVLREALGEVVFAAAADESRPILTGVLTRLTGDQMTLAAADNYRIAVRDLTLAKPVSAETAVVVPGRAYAELTRILPDADTEVKITVTPNRSQILFHVEDDEHGIDLVSRLIEGQFPNYEPIVPRRDASTSQATIDREAFLAGTRRAGFFARDSANIVKVEVGGDGAGGSVTISAHAADIGDNADTLEARVDGTPTTIAFNARYLTDVLGALGEDEVVLELSGPLAPGVIRAVGKDDYVHVIMPVRTAS